MADWNGPMIASFAKAGRAFKNKAYTDAAEKAYSFIIENMYVDGKLLHIYRDGESAVDGFLNDYTFMAWAAIELYTTTLNISYLEQARRFMDYVAVEFDDGTGVYNMTAASGEKLLFAKQEFNDMAIPSGNSVAFLVFSELARLTGTKEYDQRAETLAMLYARSARYMPTSRSIGLYTLEKRQASTYDVVVVGDPTSGDTKKMIEQINGFAREKNVYLLLKTNDNAEKLGEVAPFTNGYKSIGGKTTAYICRDKACLAPLTDVGKFIEDELLEK